MARNSNAVIASVADIRNLVNNFLRLTRQIGRARGEGTTRTHAYKHFIIARFHGDSAKFNLVLQFHFQIFCGILGFLFGFSSFGKGLFAVLTAQFFQLVLKFRDKIDQFA